MSQYGFYFDQTRCIGCRTCMIACKDHNGLKPGKASYRKFEEFEEGDDMMSLNAGYIVHGCNHCSAPLCTGACPVGAIKKRASDGIVLINRELCTGCGDCIIACPWNIPQIADDKQEPDKDPRWQARHPAQKCTMCYDRMQLGKNPACVDSCIMRALDAGPIEYLEQKYPGSGTTAKGFLNGPTSPSIRFKSK